MNEVCKECGHEMKTVENFAGKKTKYCQNCESAWYVKSGKPDEDYEYECKYCGHLANVRNTRDAVLIYCMHCDYGEGW